MSDLYSDAFKDDKREERLFGADILEETTVHDYSRQTAAADIPESKSNNVSFMKVEELSRDCRNILAVSDSHICYSVTQKKNLLRIIDTQLGEKVILRGHEHFVVDLAFAIADPGLLCSVDNGGGAAENWNDVTGKPHTIVWSKREQGDWRVFSELPLRATMVKAHPLQAHTWLIAQDGRLGVFSSQRSAAQPVASYEALPMHVVLGPDETVADAAFSSSGRHIVVAVRSAGSASPSLQVFRAVSSGGADSLQRLYSESPLAVPNLMAVQWTGDHIVTVAAVAAPPASSPTVAYCVSMWLCAAEQEIDTSTRPRVVQSVTLQLPRSAQGLASTSLLSPQLECALSLEPKERQRYLLLSSRRSNFVACLAVNPSVQNAAPVIGQPLYHVTCLNLRAPVISVGVTTVLGQAHHSSEAGEHLEVSAYQEAASDPGQASIQQYHVLFGQMFDFSAYNALPQLQAQAQAQAQAPVKTLARPASATKPSSAPPAAAAATSNPNPSPWDEALSVPSGSNKGMTILNMLNNFSRPAAGSSTPSTPGTPLTASAAVPMAALTTPGIVRPTSAGSQQSAFTPTAANRQAKLNEYLSGKWPPADSAPAAAASTDGLPDFLLNTQPAPVNSSILNVLKAASGAKVPTTPVPAPSTAPALQQSTPVQAKVAAAVTPVATAPAASAPSTQAKTPAALAPVPVQPTPPASAAKQTSKQSAQVPAPAVLSGAGADASQELLVQTVRDLQSSQSAASAQQQVALLSLQQAQAQSAKQLQQSVKDLQAAQGKHNEGVLAAMKKAVEAEAKRAIEQNTASAGTMRVEMSEQIMKELVPTISSKVRDSVRDTVRDAVKSQLPAAFRESFESALLPAFEAGAQAMFQQLQSAFVQGMQGVLQEGARVQQSSAAHSSRLEQEVRDLRQSVASLESTVASLAQALQSVLARDQQQQGGAVAVEAEAPEDAFSLLRQGRISDAVVRVLEDKDIAVTVSLLEQLTPAQVTASCSHLERLCITQQLAADMSVNIPIEGIGKRVDWVKSLVLSLLSNRAGDSSHGDPNYAQHFTSMIGVVLASISAAKKLICAAQYDTGEDDGLSALQIPQSVGTDLDLLEFVIQSKIAK